MKKNIAAILVIITILSGCASGNGKYEKIRMRDREGYHPATNEEVKIGEQINAQILSSFHAYTEPKVLDYIERVVKKIAEKAKRHDIQYRITVLYDDQIYATSAPGGFLYITTGMISFFDNEAELAAVIAHEIGQLQYRDPRFSNAKKFFEQATQLGATVGPAFGPIGSLAAIGLVMIGAAAGVQGRDPEGRLKDADRLALHYLLAAGYDPQAMLDVQAKFLTAEERKVPLFYHYYESRPISEGRMHDLQKEFQKLPLTGKNLTMEYPQYQEATKGVREIYRA